LEDAFCWPNKNAMIYHTTAWPCQPTNSTSMSVNTGNSWVSCTNFLAHIKGTSMPSGDQIVHKAKC